MAYTTNNLSRSDFIAELKFASRIDEYPYFENRNIANEAFNGELIERAIFRNCLLTHITFECCALDRVEFEGCTLVNVVIHNPDEAYITFKNCLLINCVIIGKDHRIRRLKIENSELITTSLVNTAFDQLDIIGSKWRNSVFYNSSLRPKAEGMLPTDDKSELDLITIDCDEPTQRYLQSFAKG